MRDRLIEIFKKTKYKVFPNSATDYNLADQFNEFALNDIVEKLLVNGVVAPLLKTGQIVYRVSKGRMWEVKIWKIEICGETVSYIDNYDKSFLSTHIGKGVFLTREEAEAKLKEGE